MTRTLWIWLSIVMLAAVGLSWAMAGRMFDVMRNGSNDNGSTMYVVTPEYDRTAKTLVMSMAPRDKSLVHHNGILRGLPGYSEVILMVPECNSELIRAELNKGLYPCKVRLLEYDSSLVEGTEFFVLFPEMGKLQHIDPQKGDNIHQRGTIWAQDLFEVIKDVDGQITLLVPDVHKYYYAKHVEEKNRGQERNVNRDIGYIESLSSAGMKVETLPIAFMGGNVLIDVRRGKRIVFCGGDIFRKTRVIWQASQSTVPTDTEIVQIVKSAFKADEVVVIGAETVQPTLLYHLDQGVIILPDGNVGIERVVDKAIGSEEEKGNIKQVEQFLSEARDCFLGMGYKVFDIDVTSDNVLNSQHYANAIQYLNVKTAERVLLMPVFPDSQSAVDSELLKKNTKSFESLGYKVHQVQTLANQLRGGIHCLVNVVE